ncbi:hypothetical protein PQX77_009899, partial [Marasmius sp. AFHP31]
MQEKRSQTTSSSFSGGSTGNSRRTIQFGCTIDPRDLGGVDPLKNELTVMKRRLEETEDELNQQHKNVMMLLREKAEAEKRHIKTVEDLERRIEALESQCKGDVEEEITPFGPIYISSSESESEDADQGDHSNDSDEEEGPTEVQTQHEDAAQPPEDPPSRPGYIGRPKEELPLIYLTDPEHLSGAFEVPIIGTILRAIFSIPSIKQKINQPDYRGDFNPVSLELMGFILTLVKFCICEWEYGAHEREDFFVKKHLKDYKDFMTVLHRWKDRDPARALR